MRRIKVKRLMYHNLATNEIAYGGEEYDGDLTDENILGCIHEVGKSIFQDRGYTNTKSCLLLTKGDLITHRVTVETFYQYQKSWYDLFIDNMKRWFN